MFTGLKKDLLMFCKKRFFYNTEAGIQTVWEIEIVLILVVRKGTFSVSLRALSHLCYIMDTFRWRTWALSLGLWTVMATASKVLRSKVFVRLFCKSVKWFLINENFWLGLGWAPNWLLISELNSGHGSIFLRPFP